MDQTKETTGIGTAAKIGAVLFVLWGVLHIWVGYEGIDRYLASEHSLWNASGERVLWDLLIGGRNAPRAAFQHATSSVTANAHAHLILNFCIDVGGYGVLGLVVGWMIWRQASWAAYLIGVFIIGICDLAFLFSLVTPGIIELNVATISGPVIWFIAVGITPFGMPSVGGRSSRTA